MVTQRGVGFAVFVLAGILGFSPQPIVAGSPALTTPAQGACNGPAALVGKLEAHPGADNAVELGSWYASHKQFGCAIATFRDGLKSDPGSAQLHYLIGLADVAQNHTADALLDLQRAVELDPGVIKPHLLLAYVYDQSGEQEKAEDQFHRALTIDPKSEPALGGLSQDLLRRGDSVDVALLLRSAPRTERLTINLAKALGNLNMLDEARDVLTQTLNENPKSLPLSKALIAVLAKETRVQDAINLARHVVDENPGNQDAEVQLFRILVLTNHFDEARPIGPKLLAQRPRDPEVQYLNGMVLRSIGDNLGARKLLEQSIAGDPSSLNAHYELGIVLVVLKDWASARQELEKAIAMGEKAPQVHYHLALALRGMGDASDAQKEIQIFETLKRNDEARIEAAMKASQADEELKSDQVQPAIDHLKQAIEEQPDNADFKYKLALALHRSGDTASEREQLEQAIKLDPGFAAAQNELGFLLSRQGDSTGAIEHFRQAVQAAPGYVEAWINLAGELAMTGQFPDARTAVAMALRLDPENELARKLSDRLAHDPSAQQARP
ncbi:MAG TPA: tetratricopeptide repeat protein [Terracidiphilus sp.]